MALRCPVVLFVGSYLKYTVLEVVTTTACTCCYLQRAFWQKFAHHRHSGIPGLVGEKAVELLLLDGLEDVVLYEVLAPLDRPLEWLDICSTVWPSSCFLCPSEG